MCVRASLWLYARRGHADPHYTDLGKGGTESARPMPIKASQRSFTWSEVFQSCASLQLYSLRSPPIKINHKKMSQSSQHGQNNHSSSGSSSSNGSSTGAQGWQPVTTETNRPSGWQQGSGGGWQQGSGGGASGWQPGSGGGSSGWQQSSSGGGMSAGRQQGTGRGSRWTIFTKKKALFFQFFKVKPFFIFVWSLTTNFLSVWFTIR